MRKTIMAAFAAATLLLTSGAPAFAATSTHSHTTSAGWCQKKQPSGRYYYLHKKHWDCVSPGAFCSTAQRNAYGYSMRAAAHAKRYKCVRYPSNTWHWKPKP
ncbi:hypothetical protein [Microtetraspora malaysiensis]|uniref:hypothetical protein n=1 Tax=Microtetraspora malaysiensis TaxID=161358 RepID=UPI0012F79845|nr:hypothetical protein [Microtetraspora malaysiensis]